MRILRSTSFFLLRPQLLPSQVIRTQAAFLNTKNRPFRPTERGEVTAYFPQQDKTIEFKDGKEVVLSRWKEYLKELGGAAVPKRFGGPKLFESRVRNRRRIGPKERIPKEHKSGKH